MSLTTMYLSIREASAKHGVCRSDREGNLSVSFLMQRRRVVSVGNTAGEKSFHRIYVGFDATGRDLSIAFVWIF